MSDLLDDVLREEVPITVALPLLQPNVHLIGFVAKNQMHVVSIGVKYDFAITPAEDLCDHNFAVFLVNLVYKSILTKS